MRHELVPYLIDNQEFIGHFVIPDDTEGKRPAILVAHAWRGLDDFAKNKAQELASMGYIAFTADLYGGGKVVQTNEESAALMMPLFIDRATLQKRIRAAYDLVFRHPLVDISKIGGIGFCFGGLTIIELLRSGADVRGVVSFHGILGNQMGDQKAQTVPIANSIKGSLLILHGHEDPLVSNEDIQKLQTKLTEARVDWQMHIYGHTAHAFTNPLAQDKEGGLMFNPKAARRAWQAMGNFFNEILL